MRTQCQSRAKQNGGLVKIYRIIQISELGKCGSRVREARIASFEIWTED